VAASTHRPLCCPSVSPPAGTRWFRDEIRSIASPAWAPNLLLGEKRNDARRRERFPLVFRYPSPSTKRSTTFARLRWPFPFPFAEGHRLVPLGRGLRSKEGANQPGAQTGRPGDARPVRVLFAASTHRPPFSSRSAHPPCVGGGSGGGAWPERAAWSAAMSLSQVPSRCHCR
jgi:hypothetical protein